jgi:phage protein D
MATSSGRSAPVYILFAQPDGSATSTRVDVSDRIKSLSYEDVEKGPDKLTLKVQNQDYSNFANPIFADGTTLLFSYGYADGTMSPQRTAIITKVTGGAELTVEARGQACLLNLLPKIRTFKVMKRSDVAHQIATEQNYDAAHTFIDDTAVIIPQIAQAKMTDAMLLRDMAKKEGFEFFLDYRGFHFHKRDLGQAPRRLYTYFTDPGSGDILTPPNVENDIFAKPGSVTVKGIDPKTGKPFPVTTADNSSDPGRQGLGYSVQIDKASLQRGQRTQKLGSDATLATTAKSAADAKRQADARYRKVQLTAAKVTFTAVGDPLMEAKTLITLAGQVGVLAGNYYVTKVKSDLGSDFKQVLECRRDTLGRSTGVKSTASVNGQAATSGSGTDTTLDRKVVVDPRTQQTRTVFVPKGSPPTPGQK